MMSSTGLRDVLHVAFHVYGWNALPLSVAAERLVNVIMRVIAFVVLLLVGKLTVLAAVLVSCLSPIIAGIVYWRLLLRPPHDAAEQPLGGPALRLLSWDVQAPGEAEVGDLGCCRLRLSGGIGGGSR